MKIMIRKMTFLFLFFAATNLLDSEIATAQTAPTPKAPPEKVFPHGIDFVWNKVIEVVTEKGLSEHPHGKMAANKDAGTITTPSFRYFKIFSAKPVVENHYRDTYTITVSMEQITKEKLAKAKADEAAFLAEEAKTKREEAKDKTGDEAKTLLDEAKESEEGAKKASQEAKQLAEEAKVAAAKPKVTKVHIQRKFEIHDDTKRVWTDADPEKHKVGMTEEMLLRAIEAKIASSSPTAEPTKIENIVKPNLNLTPPVIQEEPKPAPPAPPAGQPAAAAPAPAGAAPAAK